MVETKLIRDLRIFMVKSTYRYNPKTCRYERSGVNAREAFFYAFGVLVVAVLMLAGLLILHDFIIDSEKEISLRKENNALEKNQIVLTAQLSSIESSLASLQDEDEKLHSKFFGAPMEKMHEKTAAIADRQMLLADASEFRATVAELSQRSSSLHIQSSLTNLFYGTNLSLEKQKLNSVESIPTLPPVKEWDPEKLLSGFGMRVNPFHKGLYEHPGVDIAMSRGIEIISASAGTVREVKRSNLQAGYGNYIEIDHGYGFVTRYAHLEDIKIRLGQKVVKGTVIATIGNSGGSIAPHLHYEIIRNGKNVDPVIYMVEGVSSEMHHLMKTLGKKQNQSLD